MAVRGGQCNWLGNSDFDGICDDGDNSGIPGDNPCTEGKTKECDDNCSNDYNPDQVDTDGDKSGNVCDSDDDNDSVLDTNDNCPFIANQNQEDSDEDGVGNVCDNCPYVANPGQENFDGDIAGDVCDSCPKDADDDADGDGVCGNEDNCPNVPNPNQEDYDADGLGNICDNCPTHPNGSLLGPCICGGESCMSDDDCECGSCSMNQKDTNNDGVGDACDQALCRTYLCRYEKCNTLKAAGREMNYSVCKPIQNEGTCIAAGCTWYKNSSTQAYPCMLDMCLMDWDGTNGVGPLDLGIFRREQGRSCPTTHQSGDDLCQMYYNQYQTCIEKQKDERELDYNNVCKPIQNEGACIAANCTWYKNSSTQAYPCMLDICLMDWDGTNGVGTLDFGIFKREQGRGNCPCSP
jgi:hypothetical protein